MSSTGVKEDVVLAGPAVGSRFGFTFEGTTLSLRGDGGLDMSGPVGEAFVVPAPTVVTAEGSDATEESGVVYELLSPTELVVTVDDAWLSSLPAEAFPVAIDPSWIIDPPTQRFVVANPSATPPASDIRLGRESGGRIWRSAVAYNQYVPYIGQNYQVYSAAIVYDMPPPPPSYPTRTVEVFDHGATQPGTWSAIGTGTPVTTLQVTQDDFRTGAVDVTEIMQRAFSTGASAQWFGARGTESGTTVTDYQPWLELYLYVPPGPSFVNNVSNGQVFASTTPALTAQPVTSPSGSTVSYEFQITTSPSPSSGLTVSSGPSSQTSWTVPQGALSEGVTYYAWVLTNYSIGAWKAAPTVPPDSSGRTFTVDLGLGEGGPSPTDEIGSVPGQASSPAEGAPGPSLPGSKLTVNMVDGNLSLAAGTKTMGTLAGGIAIGFRYNSLAPSRKGLRGEYFNDANADGQIDAGDVKVAERIDPTILFDWGDPSISVAAQASDAALTRWTGFLTYPWDATLELGDISSDGIRIWVDDTLVVDRWAAHDPDDFPELGSPFAVEAGVPVPIRVEWRNTSGPGVAQVFLNDTDVALIYPLDPSWLSTAPSVLPQGWSLNADVGAARWVGLKDNATSVAVFDTEGTAHEFTRTNDGSYTSPSTAPNDLLTLGDEGRFVLRDAGGRTYTFRAEGVLDSIVSATDDRTPAAHRYTYSGDPLRLRTITDPVSGRDVTLSYGGDPACPGTPTAAAGLLCEVAFWDGTATTLTYDTSGRFVRLTNPGGIVHDFAYDSAGRLTDVRDPLAVDAIAAGVRSDDQTARTQITYDTTGRVATVTQPAPTIGADRPKRTYLYSGGTAQVYVAGFTPTSGWAEQVTYDSRNRIVASTDSAGLTTTYAWDSLDRLVATTDPDGTRTTTIYDHASRPVITYGPAPTSSFNTDGTPKTGVTVPTATREIDGGIDGLAAAYWDNPYLAGGPALHDTGLASDGSMNTDWGASPPVTPGPDGWSGRWAGHLDVPTSGNYEFRVVTEGASATVWIDEEEVVAFDGPEPASGPVTTTGGAHTLTAAPHRIRVDMVDTTGDASLEVRWRPAGTGSFMVLDGSDLDPNYGLETRVTDPDGKITATEYDDPSAGIGPHHRLQTATVSDPDGLALATSVTYETPAPGSYLRRVARTLPAGNTWTTANYGGTDGPIAAVCGVTAGTPQGGRPKRITGPDPDGTGPKVARVEELVYDTVGRQVGSRTGSTTTVASAGWSCQTYDTRGRLTTQSWAAHDSSPARTVTHTYAAGGNPLVNSVSDPTGTVTSTVDLLGRTTSYTDIWGATTTTTYDRPGRITTTTGPLGTTSYGYDPATGRATTTTLNGDTLADADYDTAGRLNGVDYGNGTRSDWSYDTAGRPDAIDITDNTGTTGDRVTNSLAGRVIDQDIYVDGSGFVDANPTGDNYTYDPAGRLTTARLPGVTYDYGYGTSSGCTAPAAGDNTNRTSLTVTGSGTTTSCYNHADQLESASGITAGDIVYDDHGNTTRLGEEIYDYDAADRHVRTETPTQVTRYTRDPLDRIADRVTYDRITHVATTTNTAAAASITINRPAGTQAGDVIVASISSGGTLGAPGALTAPGWNTIASQSTLLGRTYVLYRVATGSDPTSWTFTAASAARITGALSAYRNVDPNRPISAQGATATTAALSHPYPQVTATEDARHLVHVIGFDSNSTPSNPPGTTQRAKVLTNASLLVTDRYQSRPGTSSAVASTTTLPLSSVTVTVALTPTVTTGHASVRHIAATSAASASDTVSVNRPAGTAAGDVIIAAVTARGTLEPGALNAPGWTLVASQTLSILPAKTYILYRYAAGSDPASWAFTAPNANDIVAALSTYRGASRNGPFSAVTAAIGAGTSHPFPNVTTTVEDSYLVHVLGVQYNTAITAPGSTTARANLGSGLGVAGTSQLLADRAAATPGPSTTATATTTDSANTSRFTLALLPAVTSARYGYDTHNDRPRFITDNSGAIREGITTLPGNATHTSTDAGETYSHANLHGDTITITDGTGARSWTGHTGPYGEPTTTGAAPNTDVPDTSWGWHGQQLRLTDANNIHMGARLYNPTHGRFLSVDPIEGGCANDYTYVHGDPVNSSDTTGTNWLSDRLSDAWNWTQNSCLGPIALGAVAVLAPAPIGLAIAGASLYSSIRSTTGARSSGERASSLAGSTTTFIGITLTAASGKSYAARVGGRALGVFGIGISVWSNMESGKCRWK